MALSYRKGDVGGLFLYLLDDLRQVLGGANVNAAQFSVPTRINSALLWWNQSHLSFCCSVTHFEACVGADIYAFFEFAISREPWNSQLVVATLGLLLYNVVQGAVYDSADFDRRGSTNGHEGNSSYGHVTERENRDGCVSCSDEGSGAGDGASCNPPSHLQWGRWRRVCLRLVVWRCLRQCIWRSLFPLSSW